MADADEGFRIEVANARLIDPVPTFQALAAQTGTDVDDLIHLALVRYAADGAEALLALGPASLRELVRARQAGDWAKVAGIVDWLGAGFESTRWRHPGERAEPAEPAEPAGSEDPELTPPGPWDR